LVALVAPPAPYANTASLPQWKRPESGDKLCNLPAKGGGLEAVARRWQSIDSALAEDDGPAPPRKTAQEETAEKQAAEKAAGNSFVKVKLEVELRGVLACTDEAVTVSIVKPIDADRFKEVKWVLDFGEDKELRAKAKSPDGKTVLVEGIAYVRGIQSSTTSDKLSTLRGGPKTESFLDLEPKVAVKRLVVATKE
jgi:hypothetical protein